MLMLPAGAMQAPESDVRGVLLSEEGVSAGKAKVLYSAQETHEALRAAAAVENADDSDESMQTAAAIGSR